MQHSVRQHFLTSSPVSESILPQKRLLLAFQEACGKNQQKTSAVPGVNPFVTSQRTLMCCW